MKVRMELPEMKVRYQFMENFGMREKERLAHAKKEASRFIWTPFLVSIPISIIFTIEVFVMRMPTKAMICRYVMYEAVAWVIYAVMKVLTLKYLEREIQKTVSNVSMEDERVIG